MMFIVVDLPGRRPHNRDEFMGFDLQINAVQRADFLSPRP